MLTEFSVSLVDVSLLFLLFLLFLVLLLLLLFLVELLMPGLDWPFEFFAM